MGIRQDASGYVGNLAYADNSHLGDELFLVSMRRRRRLKFTVQMKLPLEVLGTKKAKTGIEQVLLGVCLGHRKRPRSVTRV